MRLWVNTIQRVVLHDRRANGVEPSPELIPVAARTFVELNGHSGRMGLRDDEQIDWLARLLLVDRAVISTAWAEATAAVETQRARVEAAALAKFRSGAPVTMRHRWRSAGQELSRALNLTKARKQEIFAAPRSLVDGRLILGERPPTGLPTYVPTVTGKRIGEAVEKSYTYTPAERDFAVRVLGYKAGTLRRNRATLSEDEFWERILKRQMELLPADQLVDRKMPGESDWHASRRIRGEAPFTRDRKPGVTAARRAYAKAYNIHLKTAEKRTRGMDEEAIRAAVQAKSVTPDSRYECHGTPDKRALFLAFGHKFDGHQGSQQNDRDSANYAPVTLVTADMVAMQEWYLATQGRELKADTIRQWRRRDRLDAKLFAACEWVIEQGNRHPTIDAHARKRVAEYRQLFDAQRQLDRINRSVRGGLSGFVYVA